MTQQSVELLEQKLGFVQEALIEKVGDVKKDVSEMIELQKVANGRTKKLEDKEIDRQINDAVREANLKFFKIIYSLQGWRM